MPVMDISVVILHDLKSPTLIKVYIADGRCGLLGGRTCWRSHEAVLWEPWKTMKMIWGQVF